MTVNLYYKNITKELTRILKHDRWFIGGSFANKTITKPNDIDIYFYCLEDYMITGNIAKNLTSPFKSSCYADTYNFFTIGLPVQLVKKPFAIVEDYYTHVDLNVCRQVIRSNGKTEQHVSSTEPLKIINLSYDTFSRYLKYLHKLEKKEKTRKAYTKTVIDTYIEDNTILESYYEGDIIKAPANVLMYNAFKDINYCKDHLITQARLRAPELLL